MDVPPLPFRPSLLSAVLSDLRATYNAVKAMERKERTGGRGDL